ncbi:MAG: Lrp/AsnC family transcriptional regulator [Brumimicrobium sp.]|nr:Lrp/AsnC family transcriptional regulator [Brumimicrobium sp.]MCO5268776.1 Lrp/AsnC family transcriptional regulator [Brumimicrobium sp.]
MDYIDEKILEILQTDCLKTAKEMAAELALTATPIYERIKKLENAGYIKDYVALLDADLLGQSVLVILNITVKDHHTTQRDSFVEEIKSLVAITEFYQVSGTYDYVAKARFKDIKEYSNFLVNDLSAIQNINNIESQIVLEELKYSTKVII